MFSIVIIIQNSEIGNQRSLMDTKHKSKTGTKPSDNNTLDLKAPWVNSQGINNEKLQSKATEQSRRPKHMTNVSERTTEYNTAENLKMKPFTRGPRQ